ncbi:MAG TPA: DUF2071 domain-containing protein [Saprospiraceae bacterium]|nr:DUF2071 domain-containing protein [Saprospiraceae bacterium]
MSFLKAEWRRLALANYAIDPAILQPFVPYHTVLDQWRGTTYVSLVGFLFKNTRMLGIRIPFHVNFEEVNLRFYVKYKDAGEWKRGVVFIKEIVPKPALTLVANTIYREHYQTRKMRHEWRETETSLWTTYDWKDGGKWQSFAVESERQAKDILPGSEAEFITEHYWGYTRIKEQLTYEYGVTHPRWQCYPVKDYKIAVDFARVYGPAFSVLDGLTPKSVMLAEGSPITVEGKVRL